MSPQSFINMVNKHYIYITKIKTKIILMHTFKAQTIITRPTLDKIESVVHSFLFRKHLAKREISRALYMVTQGVLFTHC